MSVTTEPRAGAQLAAARLRGAQPDELLDLADAAIERADAAGDALSLELIAAELDSAAAAHPAAGDGLRIAADRARAAALPLAPSPPTVVPQPVDRAAAEKDRAASWGHRLAAWLIDWCILLGAGLLVAGQLGGSAGAVFWTFGSFAYFAYLNARGGTLGKLLLRIAVVDPTTGIPIGIGRGAARELVRLCLTVLTLGIGLILDGLRPLWNENHQTWHDVAVKSLVVRKR